MPGKVKQTWDNILTAVKQFGTNFITQAPKIAKDFKDKLVTAIKELPGKMVEIGKNIVDGLLNGIKSAWSNLTGAVGELASSFLAGVKSQFKIGSPSKLMADEVGKWIPAGIAEGIENSMDVLDAATDDIKVNLSSNMVDDAYSAMTMSRANLDLNTASAQGNTITVNMSVYGAEGQDVNALAEIIQEKINNTVFRQGAVYA